MWPWGDHPQPELASLMCEVGRSWSFPVFLLPRLRWPFPRVWYCHVTAPLTLDLVIWFRAGHREEG